MKTGWVPVVVILTAMLIVPVYALSYNAWFLSNFGSITTPFPQVPAGYATVLLLQPDTTARIYENISLSGIDLTLEGNAYQWDSLSPSMAVTVQESVVWVPWSGNVVGVFRVTASGVAHGFFRLWLSGLCPGLPLAIGIGPSQVNASDFPGLGGIYLCPAELLRVVTLSYSGFQVTFVKLN